MKKIILFLLTAITTGFIPVQSQDTPGDVILELLTVGPGTEIYSIYGHSALRIKIPSKGTDIVYNWGVFDFNTRHFAWKFAKGRLNYILDTSTYNEFLQSYFFEKRWIESQKINLEPAEVSRIFELISENMKPENRTYRYDFFYDDCSTRIRDLLEKAIGKNLIYPPENPKNRVTFRDKIGEYQRFYPWLNTGIDLLIGTPGDKKVSFRNKMFLPIDLQAGLTELMINRNGRMVPLLQNPVRELDFDTPRPQTRFYASPVVVLSVILILVILFSALNKNKKAIRIFDLTLYTVFSLLSLLLVFFNFFTDHQATKLNLNILWLSPFLLLCLTSLIMNREWIIWFRLVFFLSLIVFAIMLVFPAAFNTAFLPVLVLLLFRTSVRSGFDWNPLSV